MPEKLEAYSGGIRAATSQFSGAGEGGPKQIAFEAAVTIDAHADRLYFQRHMLSYKLQGKAVDLLNTNGNASVFGTGPTTPAGLDLL